MVFGSQNVIVGDRRVDAVGVEFDAQALEGGVLGFGGI